jgi:hypothetical protein
MHPTEEMAEGTLTGELDRENWAGVAKLWPFFLTLIHPSSWKGNSRKFGCRILHRFRSERRESGVIDHSGRWSEIYMLWC